MGLFEDIRACDICSKDLPLGPEPIVAFSPKSKIVLASQAPGRLAHLANVAWKDPSGKQLRRWLGVTEDQFYNTDNFAILPMGFCYPGKAKTGDLPPRKECAPQWHAKIWEQLKNVELILLIGAYSQQYYLGKDARPTLTETVSNYQDYLPKYFPMPHPSPTNRFWKAKNSWFEELVVPELQEIIKTII
ncbi:uracil-DNA glycosylase family protein [Winogradskyella maritima]|uniref:Uracil-DNA glycosylase family protein n=1 Tax=Winogradskyella maritima TaxID=1517766 RepID=A0ABV8AHE5_9FLAO|nr:uracil-DNA glycosylase family protein [Winogradskyella maritima]